MLYIGGGLSTYKNIIGRRKNITIHVYLFYTY